MPHDNPAARLQAVLEVGLSADKKSQCLLIWREILGANKDDPDDLFSRLGKTMDLPRQVVQELQIHFPHQVEGAKYWRGPIEKAFMNQQLGAPWETFIQHIGPQTVASLGLVADLLHSRSAVIAGDSEKVQEVADSLERLLAEISTANISQELKHFLIRSILDLVRSIREYKIVGGEAALRKAEAIVGHAGRNKEFLKFLKDEELGQRVLDSLNAVASVVTIYVSLPQLTTTTFRLLGG